MKKGFIKSKVIILFLLLIIGLSFGIEASTRVEPGKYIFIEEPGKRVTGSIKVTNKGEEEMELKAFLYDWILDEKEKLLTFEPGTQESSLQGLIKFNPRQFKLAPGQVQVVRFTVKVPEDQAWERRGIVFFEHENPLDENMTGAKVLTQIGTTIYLIPAKTKFKFNILKTKVHFTEDGKAFGILLVENEGAAHVRYRIAYKVVDEEGALLGRRILAEKIILPDMKRGIYFPLDIELRPGRYNLLLELSFYGNEQILKHTEAFEVLN